MTLLMNAQGNQNALINRTFIAHVGSLCEETPDDNPCAGQEIYLVLEFKNEEVLIVEKHISSCNYELIVHIGNYKWALTHKNQVIIDAPSNKIEDTYLKDLLLEFKNEKLLGKRKN